MIRIFRAAAGQAVHDVWGSRVVLITFGVFAALALVLWWKLGPQLVSYLAIGAAVAAPLIQLAKQVWRVGRTTTDLADKQLKNLELRRSELQAEETALRTQLTEVDAIVALGRYLVDRATTDDYDRYRGIVGQVHDNLEQLDQHMRRASAQWKKDPDGAPPPVERIVLYVDDLDRCPPNRVVDVLAAVHLLLALPLFVVVVGVDARWLRRSLEHHDRSLFGDEHATTTGAGTSGDPMDYLDKIFQIPFALRSMDDRAAAGYIRELLPEPAPTSPTPQPTPSADPAPADTRIDATPTPDPPEEHQSRRRRDESLGIVPPIPYLRPTSLTLQAHEIDYLAQLGVFLPTPRAVKKLVNLYRLVRVGVPPTDLASFAATSDSEPFRAAGLLLAIVVGTPTVATSILQAVRQAAPDADSYRTLRGAASHTGTSTGTAAPPDRDTAGAPLNRHHPAEQDAVDATCTTCQTWLHLLGGLDQLAADRPGIPTAIRPFQPWAPELARFSFYTRPLWARLTPKEQSQASGQSQHTSESLPH